MKLNDTNKDAKATAISLLSVGEVRKPNCSLIKAPQTQRMDIQFITQSSKTLCTFSENCSPTLLRKRCY